MIEIAAPEHVATLTLEAEISAAVDATVTVSRRRSRGVLVVVGTDNEAKVREAVEAHDPPAPSDPDTEFHQAIQAATSVADLKAALLGTSVGPGAEPRRAPR